MESRAPADWPSTRLPALAVSCIAVGALLGVHLNSTIALNQGVVASIFLVYGACSLLAGALYVIPPVSLGRRVGGEVVLWAGLGLLPVLGAYLVQAGDLTRTVYLASAPLVVSIALWVWMDELTNTARDAESGRQTMVLLFGFEYSRKLVVPVLLLLLYATVLIAVLTSSVPPFTLAILLSVGLAWRIVVDARGQPLASGEFGDSLGKTIWLYFATGLLIAVSPLLAQLI